MKDENYFPGILIEGLTMREYFAFSFLIKVIQKEGDLISDLKARDAVRLADALIEALNK